MVCAHDEVMSDRMWSVQLHVNSLTSIAITEPKWELCTLIVRILPTLVGTKT